MYFGIVVDPPRNLRTKMFINISVNKWKKILVLIILLALFAFILGQILQNHEEKKLQRKRQRSDGIPLVIWWTPIMKDYVETRMCDKYFCKFTSDRREKDRAKVSGLTFLHMEILPFLKYNFRPLCSMVPMLNLMTFPFHVSPIICGP